MSLYEHGYGRPAEIIGSVDWEAVGRYLQACVDAISAQQESPTPLDELLERSLALRSRRPAEPPVSAQSL